MLPIFSGQLYKYSCLASQFSILPIAADIMYKFHWKLLNLFLREHETKNVLCFKKNLLLLYKNYVSYLMY